MMVIKPIKCLTPEEAKDEFRKAVAVLAAAAGVDEAAKAVKSAAHQFFETESVDNLSRWPF